MTLPEFAALAVGDKIENRMHGSTATGEIVTTEPNGVRVVWGRRFEHETRFFYSVQSTAWFHWSKVENNA